MALLSCSHDRAHRPGGPYYFADWGGYALPLTLYNEIPPERARERKTYYEAFFSEAGRVVRVCKYLDGLREWEDSYSYSSTGTLAKRVMVKADGKMIVQHFDENGRIQKEQRE